MSWNPVRSKPVSMKTKGEGRDQINLAREGQNSFLSFGGAFRYRRRPLTHTLTWRKAGVWPHLREVSTGQESAQRQEAHVQFLTLLLTSWVCRAVA